MPRRIIRYDQPATSLTAAAPRVSLEIVRGKAHNKLRPVKTRAFLIGSADDCDLVLGDRHFPSVHAYMFRNQRETTIRWLGSGPELTVNRQVPIESLPLADQDVIRTGPFEFVVRIEPTSVLAAGHRRARGASGPASHLADND